MFYRKAEVAEMLRVRPATVSAWISKGKRTADGVVRLRTLVVPRGRIAAADLAAFLEATNGYPVLVAGEGFTTKTQSPQSSTRRAG